MKGRAKQRKMAAMFELPPGKRYARRMGLHLPLPLRIAQFGGSPGGTRIRFREKT